MSETNFQDHGPSVEDELMREAARVGRAGLAVIEAYQQRNPGRRIPRSVQRDAHRAVRMQLREQQIRIAQERAMVQLDISEQIKLHGGQSIQARRYPAATPQAWAEQQWQLDQRRQRLEQAIMTAPHLSREERGQAVTALTASHYADDPRVPQPPAFPGRPSGIAALRARLSEQVTRAKHAVLERREQMRARGEMRMPATTVKLPVHPYWQRSAPEIDAQTHRLEQTQRRLAEQAARELRVIRERDQLRVERDQMQRQIASMGEQLGEAARQHAGLAEDLAQRGQELTDAHRQIDEVIEQRDAAVRKVAAMTPPEQRLGSPERQAAASQQAAATGRKTATGAARPSAKSGPKSPAAKAPTVKAVSDLIAEDPERPEIDADRLVNQARETREAIAEREPELVGAVAGGTAPKKPTTRRVNGSRKVTGHASKAPEIPLPPEPPTGMEPPDMFDR